ncbi:hypothetical protein ACFOD9_02010 [Novosphingobium bradum]|uniref:Uncharacterized protein n=1 Tax=Novosphingobium bradum TaxID=1737444 RepID=A0ABV7ILC0_9SPHN
MNRPGPVFSVSGAVFLPANGAQAPDPHLKEMATMLAEISTQLEALGEVLCRDPEFVDRHVQALQAIDLIAQKQRALADVLGAECPTSALAGVGLEEVVGRFKTLTRKRI